MKGLFIPEITAEMFRNGCLESIEALMAEGEIYDIEYEPQQQWVPCSEKLPEEDDVYLVTVDPRYIAFYVTQIDMLNWHENKWWYFDIDEKPAVFPDPIIAWMPLPAPYRENNT